MKKLLTLVFSFVILAHGAENSNWKKSKLYETNVYLGLTCDDNIKYLIGIDLFACGKNEQQKLSKKGEYNISTGCIEITTEKIYLNEKKSVYFFHPTIMIQAIEPLIMKEDFHRENSLVYTTEKVNPRICKEPIVFEYKDQYAESEALKDLKKSYEALFSFKIHKNENKSIAFIPLKLGHSLKKIAMIALSTMYEFIKEHRKSYASIYILVNTNQEYDTYANLINYMSAVIMSEKNVS